MTHTLRAVVSAGGTREPLDDVRELTNRSTGRLGVALARALAWRGVDVVLLASAEARWRAGALPARVTVIPFSSTRSLGDAIAHALDTPTDLVLWAAAVADYAPEPVDGKVRSTADRWDLALTRTPKLLDRLRPLAGPACRLVGFKLLSGVDDDALAQAARGQIDRAGLDATVANDARRFSEAAHPALWVTSDGVEALNGPRDTVADAIIDRAMAGLLPDADGHPGHPEPDAPRAGAARRWWRLDAVFPAGLPAPSSSPIERTLAARAAAPDRGVCVPDGVRAWLGHGELDAARTAAAWRRVSRLGAVPVVHHGGIVAALHPAAGPQDAPTVVPTGLGDDDVWPMAVLPHHPARRWRLAGDPAAWAARGFRPETDGTWTAPWHRDDARPAASVALLHRPSGRVLVGPRGRSPRQGALAFPGGRCEPGETPLDAARRELREETGLDAPPWPAEATWTVFAGPDPCWRLTCHLWSVLDPLPTTPTPELDARWWALDAARRHPDALPGVRFVLSDLAASLVR